MQIKLTFDPSKLSYSDPLADIFRTPRKAVIWCIRKSRHITDQHFIDSVNKMYSALLDGLPTDILDFYEIYHKSAPYGEIDMYETKNQHSYRFGAEYIFSQKNLDAYFRPFFNCWHDPSKLKILICIDGKETEYKLPKMSMEAEKEEYLRMKEEIESDIRYEENLDYQKLKFYKKLDSELGKQIEQFNICKRNQILVKGAVCPVCGINTCLHPVTGDDVLKMLGIEGQFDTEKHWR